MLDEVPEDEGARTASAEVRYMCPCTAPMTRLPTGIDLHDRRGGDFMRGARGGGGRGRRESGLGCSWWNVKQSSLAMMRRAGPGRLCCMAC